MVATAEKSRNQADSMYSRVLSRIWLEEEKAGHSIPGIGRKVNHLPVSNNERRPIIGVEQMNIEASDEATRVTALRRPEGVLRLAFSTTDAAKLYGKPLAISSDYGEPIEQSHDPRNKSVGVDIAPGEEPRLVVERVDGKWDALDEIKTVDAVRVAGAITKAIADPEKDVEVIDPSDSQLTAHIED